MKIKKFVREHGSKEIEQFLLSNSDSMWAYIASGKELLIRHYELLQSTIYMTQYALRLYHTGDGAYIDNMMRKSNSRSMKELAAKLNSGKYIWDESPEYKTSWEYEWAANIRI